MSVRSIQYRILGFMMLAVFTLSFMPRQLLHDTITNHTHKAGLINTGEESVSRVSFICDAAGEVVKSPFTVFEHIRPSNHAEKPRKQNSRLLTFTYTDSTLAVLLRGPPSQSFSSSSY